MASLSKRIDRVLNDNVYRFNALARRGFYNKLSDEQFIRKKWKAFYGTEIDLEVPKSLNEKMQWLKLHDRNPLYTKLVDKYAVKDFVADALGKEYVIPTLGAWDRYEDIDFDRLPDRFVLKCNHDSGSVKVVLDKSEIEHIELKKYFDKKLADNYYLHSREWPYKNVKPRVIAEEYLADLATQQIIDYKFFCMNGKPAFLYVSVGLDDHSTAKISFYSLDGRELPFKRGDYAPFHNAKMPANYELMKEIAGKLAADISTPFVRVDLYEINNKILFSEFTFFPCEGFIPFEPKEWDMRIGEMLKLPNKK